MIVSAGRRTDIPALYSEWFMRRMRAGFCLVRRPFGTDAPSRVSLDPADIDAVVFWTRNPGPMIAHLPEVKKTGLNCIFLVTVTGYPRSIEPRAPALQEVLRNLAELSRVVGPERVTWHYDHVVMAEGMDAAWHAANFSRLARALSGSVHRVVISFMDEYAKIGPRLARAGERGAAIRRRAAADAAALLPEIAAAAKTCKMTAQTCAQPEDLSLFGVPPGACIDPADPALGLAADPGRDTGQRKHCLCTESVDIGAYDTCVFGCAYCYAVRDFARSHANFKRHDPDDPFLAPATKR